MKSKSTTGFNLILLIALGIALAFISENAYADDTAINSTYVGGLQKEIAVDAAFDSEGNVFLVGFGDSDDFLDNSIPGLTKNPGAMEDVFLFKFSSDLSEILAATYIGGNGNDNWPEVAVDSNDNVFVSGETNSTDFTTTNGAYDELYSDKGDVFIVKFNNNLTQLLSSTLIGDATDYEENWGLHIDPIDDEVFLLGETNATASTTVSYIDGTALQPTHNTKIGESDQAAFIVKFDNNLSTKLGSTFVSSNDFDENYSMKIHPDGNIFLELMTNATENDWAPAYDGKIANTFTGNPTNQIREDFTPENLDVRTSLQEINDILTALRNGDASNFLTDAQKLLVSAEINSSTAGILDKGTNRADLLLIIENNEFLTKNWHLAQSKLPVPSQIHGHRNNPDHFMNTDIMITSFTNDLSTINSARYLGGSGLDAWMDFVIHDDKLYLAGETYSVDFPVTPGTLYQNHGLSCNNAGDTVDGSGHKCSSFSPSDYTYTGATERNTFVTVMDADLSLADPIISSTYIGLDDSNDPSDIAVDPLTGNIFVTGQFGENKSLENIEHAIQENIGSGTDGIIIKFNGDLTTWIQSTYIGGSGYEDNFEIYFTDDASLYVATETNSDDFPGTENGAQVAKGGKYDLVISRIAIDLLTDNVDTDRDGIEDIVDNCPTVSNADQADTDGDGAGDVCDSTPNGDNDSDTIDNLADNCPDVANLDQLDTDGDGIGDVCDPLNDVDIDADGILNIEDNCLAISNADQLDTDGDGAGDVCDAFPDDATDNDADLDGYTNDVDNCPNIFNPDQADMYGDGIGDACTSSGGGNDEHKTRPTFGIDYHTFDQRVVDGLQINSIPFTVMDNNNYFTHIQMQNLTIGEVQNFTATTYAPKTLRVLEFLFGIPEVGAWNHAEVSVAVYLDFRGEIQEIETKTVEAGLVNFTSVKSSASRAFCNPTDNTPICNKVSLEITFDEAPIYNVLALQAIDYKNRNNILYFNDGVDFHGESKNPPKQMQIISPLKYKGLQTIERIDREDDIWITVDEQEPVSMYQRNSFGTFNPIEWRDFESLDKPVPYVMERDNPHFDKILKYTLKNAKSVFNSELIQKEIGPSYQHDDEYYEWVARHDKYSEALIQERLRAESVFIKNYNLE